MQVNLPFTLQRHTCTCMFIVCCFMACLLLFLFVHWLMSAANTLMNANVHITHCMYSTCACFRLLVESAPVAVLTCVESVVVVQF